MSFVSQAAAGINAQQEHELQSSYNKKINYHSVRSPGVSPKSSVTDVSVTDSPKKF